MSAGLISVYAALLGLAYLAGAAIYFETKDGDRRHRPASGRRAVPQRVKAQRRR
ncbi:hypothetical protein [Mesorhizobium retamae]|uniref:Uncharacterized protein n=1 Tax=Mesorhizobium retamae TaxID=2912854 RepID=A0ABS9QF63_9HYPH|nr:hypothetical protein [Mesorhizobium sp. IRAMC:0171]MCG7506052.1 hypothetical protein [Mesorhizobium sp. IRAMC:0171]